MIIMKGMVDKMSNEVIHVGVVGKPGMEVSACIDVLKQGFCTDVGIIIKEELDELNPVQKGYREDMDKYTKQVKDYNDKSRK
jgi:hypothetical protein